MNNNLIYECLTECDKIKYLMLSNPNLNYLEINLKCFGVSKGYLIYKDNNYYYDCEELINKTLKNNEIKEILQKINENDNYLFLLFGEMFRNEKFIVPESQPDDFSQYLKNINKLYIAFNKYSLAMKNLKTIYLNFKRIKQ